MSDPSYYTPSPSYQTVPCVRRLAIPTNDIALIELGVRTQMRFVVDPRPEERHEKGFSTLIVRQDRPMSAGDTVVVCESWTLDENERTVVFERDRAARDLSPSGRPTGDEYCYPSDWLPPRDGTWNPADTMPADICRLFLRVKEVTVHRLDRITREDCIAEGLMPSDKIKSWRWIGTDAAGGAADPRVAFSSWWNAERATRTEHRFHSGAYVWAVKFEVTQ